MILNVIVKTVKRKSHRGSQAVTSDNITTDIIACVNEATRDVAKLLPKRFWYKIGTPISVAAGALATPSYVSLASDVQEPGIFHFTRDSSTYRLTKIVSDLEWFDRVWNPNTPPQYPVYFREIGQDVSGNKQIEIFPAFDTTTDLNNEYYKTKEADLTITEISDEIPDIPDYLQDVIEKGALYYFLKGFDDPLGQIAKRDYEESRLSLEISDERDLDTDLRLRWNMSQASILPPGFTS